MSTRAAVHKTAFTTAEEAEDAFYDAFARADLDAMMAVWSEEEEVVCVHPGAPRVEGLAAVREGWRRLFADGTRLVITLSHEITWAGTMMAIHTALEHVRVEGDDTLHPPIVATNVFMRGATGWRIVAHHASPTPRFDPMDDADAPPIVH